MTDETMTTEPIPDDPLAGIVTPEDRAEKIENVFGTFYDEDEPSRLVDILSDLRHWARLNDVSEAQWDEALAMSEHHFEAEMGEVGLERSARVSPPLTGPYGWTITRDLLAEDDANPARKGTHSNAAGMVGPCTCKLTHEEIVKRPGVFFRLLDDDGNVYYVGYASGADADVRMDPLDGFGTPNAGCTIMQIRDALCQTDWKTL